MKTNETKQPLSKGEQKVANEQKYWLTKVLPAGLWMFCVIVASAASINTMNVLPIVGGVGTLAGAIVALVKIYKGMYKD